MSKIAVFCGAKAGESYEFSAYAEMLGKTLVSRGLTLVYGGSAQGLMGVVADAVIANGGHTIGVFPSFLTDVETPHDALETLHLVDTFHERKALMNSLADAVVVLPGGFGTLDEAFEVLTWNRVGIHWKPIGFLNVRGAFDGLFKFLDDAQSHGFLKHADREMVRAFDDIDPMLDHLQAK